MTAYRERLKAGVHDAAKQDEKAQKAAQKKADAATAERAGNGTTSDKLGGISK